MKYGAKFKAAAVINSLLLAGALVGYRTGYFHSSTHGGKEAVAVPQSGPIPQTRNDSGTIQINPAPAEGDRTDMLDSKTGLAAGPDDVKGLALDVNDDK